MLESGASATNNETLRSMQSSPAPNSSIWWSKQLPQTVWKPNLKTIDTVEYPSIEILKLVARIISFDQKLLFQTDL